MRDTPRLAERHVTALVLLLGKTIKLLSVAPAPIERYLAKAFGDPLVEVREAMEALKILAAG